MRAPKHVVVGVDGSDAANLAVRAAAREAAMRHAPLRIVHGFVWPELHVSLGPPASGPPGVGLRGAATQILQEAKALTRSVEPDVESRTELVEAWPASALLGAAHDATLIVVGSRGLGGFTGLLAGSTAVQLAMYASCPTLVVRGGTEQGRRAVMTPTGDAWTERIVVGVDASDHAQAALGFAFEEAALRGAALQAAHAWTAAVAGGAQEEQHRITGELLAAWSGKYPEVPVERHVAPGHPRRMLLDAARGAALIVVGARGVGGFRGLVFGAVSHAMLHHSPCPVAIVRASR